MYEDADVLTLLNERRKTVQSFLEDIRRVRNTLAHNKKVSNIQLSLLDLYYDQLVHPLKQLTNAAKHKSTPKTYLNVSDSELSSYFNSLHEDVMSVKDDVDELRTELDKHFATAHQQSTRIESKTIGFNKKLITALAGLLLAIAGIAT